MNEIVMTLTIAEVTYVPSTGLSVQAVVPDMSASVIDNEGGVTLVQPVLSAAVEYPDQAVNP